MNRMLVAMALAAMVCAPSMCQGEDLAAAEQQIRAAFDKVDAFSAAAAIEASVSLMEGMPPATLTGSGDVAYKKAGATPLFCYNLTVGPPNAQMPLAKALAVCDGKALGVTATFMTQEFFTKQNATPEEGAIPPGGGPLLDALHKFATVALTGSDKVDDAEVFVLEAAPTTPIPEVPIAKAILYVDKNLGVLRKAAVFKSPSSELLGVISLRDIKINPVLSDSLFVVVTPPPKETPAATAPAPTAPAAPAGDKATK